MTSSVVGQTVERLIQLGELPPSEMEEADLTALVGADWINREGPERWKSVADGLRTPELVALIRGLVCVENRLQWMGGSVAGAIWLYGCLERRDRQLAEGIADWVLAHTSNPYVPFGRMNPGARSLAEWRQREAALSLVKQERWARTEREQADARRAADGRREERAEHARKHAAASEQRNRVLEELATRTIAARLEAVASDTLRPVDFYPVSWATLTPEEIATIPPHVRHRLMEKLRNRRRGPWRKLYEALRAADDEQ